MPEGSYALMRGGRMYTLRRWRPPPAARALKWQAFIDGRPWRLFKTKREWEEAVAREPEEPNA